MSDRQKLTPYLGPAALGACVIAICLALALGVEHARAQAAGGGAGQEGRGISSLLEQLGGTFPHKPVVAGGCCRWELAAVSGHGPASAESPRGPVTMLLDQCAGRTWVLARGPRGEFEWHEVPRSGPWAFGLE